MRERIDGKGKIPGGFIHIRTLVSGTGENDFLTVGHTALNYYFELVGTMHDLDISGDTG